MSGGVGNISGYSTTGQMQCSLCGEWFREQHSCAIDPQHQYFCDPHPKPQPGSAYWVPPPPPVTLEAIRQIIRQELERCLSNAGGAP